MFPNRYWSNYWADRYWPTVEEDAPPVTPAGDDRTFYIGMGVMGKTRNHPAPIFSRVKQ